MPHRGVPRGGREAIYALSVGHCSPQNLTILDMIEGQMPAKIPQIALKRLESADPAIWAGILAGEQRVEAHIRPDIVDSGSRKDSGAKRAKAANFISAGPTSMIRSSRYPFAAAEWSSQNADLGFSRNQGKREAQNFAEERLSGKHV